MSRRRGEFEHRTSIFEGAFRAWSHLGGLLPEDLELKAASDLDPLTNPIENDTRSNGSKARNSDGSVRREYPYEPLPRSGLAHPYVQAVLSPWLGPDADNEAIQLGLTTLRTWWQHRRKGESGSAIAALGTEKMKGVVEGYTRHFFTLAHCLIINDQEQPPRTLHAKMKELEKLRSKRNKKRSRDKQQTTVTVVPSQQNTVTAAISADLTDANLSPLERLHAAQRRQLDKNTANPDQMTTINLKGKCIPGKVDLPGMMEVVNRNATQLAHRGGLANGADPAASQGQDYGDPNITPVVFVSSTGDIQIAMTIDGITCAHCVKIVETVLKGCNGSRSPIEGLLDAAADRVLNSVLIRIDRASSAKRIAFEAARNLAMVGYTAKAMEMGIIEDGSDAKRDLASLSTAFEVVATTDDKDVFDWRMACTCPDNGVLREDCARHSQMNTSIFNAFRLREQQVNEYMAGCGMKYGMACTCGPSCRCQNCPEHSNGRGINATMAPPPAPHVDSSQQADIHAGMFEASMQVDQNMNFFGMEPPSRGPVVPLADPPSPGAALPIQDELDAVAAAAYNHRAQRNPSVISYGNSGLRHMSITSETTFGRAMSGLSALSIDWENLDDFDVDVDHSAHINNGNVSAPSNNGGRRSSLRRSFIAIEQQPQLPEETHVSFKD